MRSVGGHTEAARQYAAAHAVQYVTKDMRRALELHRGIMDAHPNTQEAEYARTQIQNIVKCVVPKEVLLEDQLGLALAYLEEESGVGEAAPVTLCGPELTS